jgi:penicillin-binding protein 1C
VKTGTSSDFRDTWTVGFTRDVTVATWVGNFDGMPMQRVTGVTGAAPLWNRIMLHLAERREPEPFPAPHGYARREICATTGTIPDRTCESVVAELLDAGDRRALRATPHQAVALAIDSPHDGARYLPGGTILLRANGALGAPVRWSVNGRIAGDGPAVPLQLDRGRYTIRAESAHASAVANVVVADERVRGGHTGFTVTR